MKRNQLFVLGACIFALAFVIAAFIGIKRSPQYTMYTVGKAVKQRDYATFTKYVDVDTLFDNIFTEAMKESKTEDAGLFAGLLVSMIDGLKGTAKASLKQSIESGDFGKELLANKSLLDIHLGTDINKQGKIATVTFSNAPEVIFSMRKEGNIWRIINIKGYSEIAPASTEAESQERQLIEKEIKDNITLATIEIKVNSASRVSSIPSLFGEAEKAQSGNVFIKVNVTLKNITDEDFYISDDLLVIADAESNQYEIKSTFMSGDKNALYGETVKSGLIKTGNLYIEVPSTVTGLTARISHRDKAEDYMINLGL